MEGALRKAPLAAQVLVMGRSLERALVSVVVPAEAPLRDALGAGGDGPWAEVCAREAANSAILSALTAAGRQAGLKVCAAQVTSCMNTSSGLVCGLT